MSGVEPEVLSAALTYWLRRGLVRKVHVQAQVQVGYRLADGSDEEAYALQCLKKKARESQKGGALDEQEEAAGAGAGQTSQTGRRRRPNWSAPCWACWTPSPRTTWPTTRCKRPTKHKAAVFACVIY